MKKRRYISFKQRMTTSSVCNSLFYNKFMRKKRVRMWWCHTHCLYFQVWEYCLINYVRLLLKEKISHKFWENHTKFWLKVPGDHNTWRREGTFRLSREWKQSLCIILFFITNSWGEKECACGDVTHRIFRCNIYFLFGYKYLKNVSR